MAQASDRKTTRRGAKKAACGLKITAFDPIWKGPGAIKKAHQTRPGDRGPVGLGGTPRALARLVSLFNPAQKKRAAQWRPSLGGWGCWAVRLDRQRPRFPRLAPCLALRRGLCRRGLRRALAGHQGPLCGHLNHLLPSRLLVPAQSSFAIPGG